MQFYLDGYVPGDPTVHAAAPEAYSEGEPFPQTLDVLVVGTGPAGCVLGAQLAAFPGILTRIIERREGPLERGQADGVACRTVEMFQAFGLATTMLDEAYWVNESVFWGPDAADATRIVRTGRVRDTEDGLSEMPHVIVNQARLQNYLLEKMSKSPSRLRPDYGVAFVGLRIEPEHSHPVVATLRQNGREFDVRAKYVVGCDGARSEVRQSIGRTFHGDAGNHAWGVLDILGSTDFPDVRFKSLIQTAGAGSILLIPREGGHLVRLYVDLGAVDERTSIRDTPVSDVIATAQRILHPYTLEVREVVWFSVYEVGQRIADGFDDRSPGHADMSVPRVFIAGDACHTHSAKAGQGMNVSMQDAFNLGWKIAAVIEGRSAPELLRTYSEERRQIAQDLIDFDKRWSATIAAPMFDPLRPQLGGNGPGELAAAFIEAGRYTAGLATRYSSSAITGRGDSHALATGFPVGMRFHSALVTRISDGKEMHLGHTHEADGRWRLYVFADAAGTAARALLAHLRTTTVPRFTPAAADQDSVLDVRGVFPLDHRDLDVMHLDQILRPLKGKLKLRDYEKAFSAHTHSGADIYVERGVDPGRGALVVVRPDQYVAEVLPLASADALDAFLEGALIRSEA